MGPWRKQTFRFAALLFTLYASVISLAQSPEVLEDVYATGYMTNKKSSFGLINNGGKHKLIELGQQLGDFKVVFLAENLSFQLKCEDQTFLVNWYGGAEGAAGSSGPVLARLDEAGIVQACQAVAGLTEKNLYCDPDLVGTVSLSGNFTSQQLLNIFCDSAKATLAELGIEGFEFQAEIVGDHIMILKPEKLTRIKGILAQESEPGKTVSVDYVNAQLSYVLERLAEDLGMEATFPPTVEELGVTVYADDMSAKKLFEVCLALQDEDFVVNWSDSAVEVKESE